ncbi:MAG: hypothetical protein R2755_07385 [Acidimicrobiales bacterium]
MLTAPTSEDEIDRERTDAPDEPVETEVRRRFWAPQLGLRARATVAAALLGLAATALLSVISYSLVRSYLLSQRDAFTARQSYANARVVRDVLASPNPDVGALLGSLRSEAGSFPLIRYEGQWFGSNVGQSEEQLPPPCAGRSPRARPPANASPSTASRTARWR